MKKKNIETPNNVTLTRTSSYREDRRNYLDAEEGRYVYWKKSADRNQPDTPIYFTLGQEYDKPDGTKGIIDKEILILLDGIDHAEDTEQDEYERHRDKIFADKAARHERSGDTGEESQNPWDTIADPKADPFSILYGEDAPVDEKVRQVLAFMEKLTDNQRDLIYDHLGAWKYLEDVRREEEARTGKEITQQAMSNRWNKIIARACKHFGVEKPRKRKK